MSTGIKSIIKSIVFSTIAASTLVASTQTQAGQDTFLGEIMWVGYSFCPRGYANADGQLLPIAQYSALFSLYGTSYGGDGRTTFALPDLRGRSPVHLGSGPGLTPIRLGQKGGAEKVTLNVNEIPSHSHSATLHATSNSGDVDSPSAAIQASARRSGVYSNGATNTDMNASSISVSNAGGNQPHENRSPYLSLRACVALVGIYPSRN